MTVRSLWSCNGCGAQNVSSPGVDDGWVHAVLDGDTFDLCASCQAVLAAQPAVVD